MCGWQLLMVSSAPATASATPLEPLACPNWLQSPSAAGVHAATRGHAAPVGRSRRNPSRLD